MAPEALRRRMAHGNVYAAGEGRRRAGQLLPGRQPHRAARAGPALDCRQGRRGAAALPRASTASTGTWEARERVVVALTGGPEGETLIRRAARIAARSAGGDLLAVHVARSDGLTGASPADLAAQRRLVETLGGTYHQVVGDDVPDALLDFARAENATQLVLGASRRSRLAALLTGPGHRRRHHPRAPATSTCTSSRTRRWARAAACPAPAAASPARRRLQGYVARPSLLPPLLTAGPGRRPRRPQPGQRRAAVPAARWSSSPWSAGSCPACWPPSAGRCCSTTSSPRRCTRFTIARDEQRARPRRLRRGRGCWSAPWSTSPPGAPGRRPGPPRRPRLLATLAGSVLRGETALPALLERVREAFGLTSVTLLERHADRPTAAPRPAARPTTGRSWPAPATAGASARRTPTPRCRSATRLLLALRGPAAAGRGPAGARRVRRAGRGGRSSSTGWPRRPPTAEPLAEADRMRTALLAAVSHDLRTPLASAKAAVTSLRSADVDWTPQDRDELLADRRRVAGPARPPGGQPAGHEPAAGRRAVGRPAGRSPSTRSCPLALDDLGPGRAAGRRRRARRPARGAGATRACWSGSSPTWSANALRYSPAGKPPLVTAQQRSATGSSCGSSTAGPGIPGRDRDRVFAPFQRLGDTDNTTGVGLGLALSRGLTEAMGGTLTPEDTPGGGLTMVVSLPAPPPTSTPRPPSRAAGASAGPGRREPRRCRAGPA